MRVPFAGRRVEHLRRYRQVIEVLLRQGFGYMIEQLDLADYIPLGRRIFGARRRAEPVSIGGRIRRTLEELGPTYVKFGQLLSTRADLIPKDILIELERLQNRVSPVAFEAVRQVVESELERPLAEAYATFDPAPIAAASIGQVHRAVLPGGEAVVVKVQRPGVARTIQVDIEVLLQLARIAEERLRPELFSPVRLAEELGGVIRRELDYTVEGRYAERFRANFAAEPGIHIPQVHWRWTTPRVLTMERISGVKVTDVAALRSMGVDPQEIARRGARAFLKQVLIDGLFQGDPHPGNIFVEPDGRIALVDFGMVGRVDDETIAAVADLFLGIIRRDIDGVAEALGRVGVLSPEADWRALRLDMAELLDRHYGKTLREIDLGTILQDTLELAYRHRLRLPGNVLLLGRALLTMEGVGRTLDPEFNALEIAGPFAAELVRRRFSAAQVAERLVREVRAYGSLLAGLPRRLDDVLARASKNQLEIRFRHEGLEQLIHRFEIASNRIGLGLIVAALIVGSSLVMQTNRGPLFLNFPIVGLAGYAAAGLVGIGLIISIIRSGRI